MTKRTRTDFLDAATELFTERGFYGVSFAEIAAELGVTKQAVIHRFGRKEKLYGEVLERISKRLEERLDAALAAGTSAEDRLVAFLLGWSGAGSNEDLRLLMRELLDNKRRAEGAGTWYLKPFLEALVELVRQVPGWEGATRARAFALVYQLLGARSYFEVSTGTLRGMFGETFVGRELPTAFEEQLEATARAALARGPRA